MSKEMNDFLLLSLMLINHEITSVEFRHWFTWTWSRMSLLILSRITLLTFPRELFEGLISRHFGWFSKLGLWSLRVINAGFSLVRSTRPDMSNSLASCISSSFIALTVPSSACL